jgi:hypothetical protein
VFFTDVTKGVAVFVAPKAFQRISTQNIDVYVLAISFQSSSSRIAASASPCAHSICAHSPQNATRKCCPLALFLAATIKSSTTFKNQPASGMSLTVKLERKSAASDANSHRDSGSGQEDVQFDVLSLAGWNAIRTAATATDSSLNQNHSGGNRGDRQESTRK